MPHITCLRNPSVGLESDYELKPTTDPKVVYIAGGGVAGMERDAAAPPRAPSGAVRVDQ